MHLEWQLGTSKRISYYYSKRPETELSKLDKARTLCLITKGLFEDKQ